MAPQDDYRIEKDSMGELKVPTDAGPTLLRVGAAGLAVRRNVGASAAAHRQHLKAGPFLMQRQHGSCLQVWRAPEA